jgi:acetyl-CoA synthetase
MKIAGKRVGPVELEALALEVDGVVSAAAVGVAHPTKGQVAVLIVTATSQRADDPDLPTEVANHVANTFGRPMRPAAVIVVRDLPRTRSGKTHRRVVRGWVTGTDPGDLSSLDNPEVEPEIRAAAVTAGVLVWS